MGSMVHGAGEASAGYQPNHRPQDPSAPGTRPSYSEAGEWFGTAAISEGGRQPSRTE